MAKLINPRYAAGYFNEAFLSTMDRERKLQEQRKQFQREMGFKRRQLDLLDAYRQEQNRISEGHLQERTRSNDLSERIYEDEKNKPEVPEAPEVKSYQDFSLIPDIESPSGFRVEYHKGLKTPSQNPKSPKENKLPTLTNRYESDAFGRLTNPATYANQELGLLGGTKFSPESDFNTVAVALLNPKMLRKVNNAIKSIGAYPTGEQLANAVDVDELTDNEFEMFKNFLDHYDQFQMNMAQPERIEGISPRNVR